MQNSVEVFMKKKTTAVTVLMYVSEIVFLALFFFLLKEHMLIKWIYVFIVGLLISPFFSRFYCGWICPINTLFKPVNFIYSKLGIKKFKTPKFMNNNVFRIIFLISFISLFIATRVLKIKLNILLYVIGIASIVNLFFEEEFWHKHICPYGSLLSIFSTKPIVGKIEIDKNKCIGCGLCQKVCPNDTITITDNNKRKIEIKECLTCFECQRVCPVSAIKYQKPSKEFAETVESDK